MKEFKKTGGARIGMLSSSWPFATLKVSKDKLELKAWLIGDLVFKPSDIQSFAPASIFAKKGLRINHKVAKYKRTVVFMTFENHDSLIHRIEQTGFFINQKADTTEPISESDTFGPESGFPIKQPVIMGVGVLSVLLFFSFGGVGGKGLLTGIGAMLALGFIVAICILAIFSESIQDRILKNGRDFCEIRTGVIAAAVVSALLLTILLCLF